MAASLDKVTPLACNVNNRQAAIARTTRIANCVQQTPPYIWYRHRTKYTTTQRPTTLTEQCNILETSAGKRGAPLENFPRAGGFRVRYLQTRKVDSGGVKATLLLRLSCTVGLGFGNIEGETLVWHADLLALSVD